MLAKQLSLLREFWTLEFFIRGITAGKLDSFRLDFVSVVTNADPYLIRNQ